MNPFSFLIDFAASRSIILSLLRKFSGMGKIELASLLIKDPEKLAKIVKDLDKKKQITFLETVINEKNKIIFSLQKKINDLSQKLGQGVVYDIKGTKLEIEIARLQEKLDKLTASRDKTQAVNKDLKKKFNQQIVRDKEGIATEDSVPIEDLSALSSSWLAFGHWEKVGSDIGNVTLTLNQGRSYTWPSLQYSIWQLMKRQTGKDGTGAGQVFWDYYLHKYKKKPTRFIESKFYKKIGYEFDWKKIKQRLAAQGTTNMGQNLGVR